MAVQTSAVTLTLKLAADMRKPFLIQVALPNEKDNENERRFPRLT
jgi:hypothetical protein